MTLSHSKILLFLLLLVSSGLLAQSANKLAQLDAGMNTFYESGPADSFLYYANAKASFARQRDDLQMWAETRLDMADFYFDHNNYEASARSLEETLAARWREPRTAEEWMPFCFIHSNRGTNFLEAGRLLAAIDAFQIAAGIFERFQYPDFDAVESIYKPLGNCYTRLGDNDKALVVFQKALACNIDNESRAGLYCDMGIACWNKHDYGNAGLNYYQGQKLTGVSNLKSALLYGAEAQMLLNGYPSEALRHAEVSLKLLKPIMAQALAVQYRCYSRRTAGIACVRVGLFAKAEQYLSGARSDALTAFGEHSRDLGKVDIARSELFLAQGNPAAAMTAANQALQAVLPQFYPNRPEDNPPVESFYEENVIFDALAAKANAAQLTYQKSGNTEWLIRALECHDLAWQAEMRLRSIFQYSTSKLDLQSSARSRDESAMRVARQLFEKTGQQIYLEKAFSIAERSKASLLSEAMQENLIRRQLASSDARFAELTALRQQYSWYEKQLLLDPQNTHATQWRQEADELVAKINDLERGLRTAYPNLGTQNLLRFQEVSATLQAGEALVEYFVGPTAVEAFIFQSGKIPVWYSFANSSDFRSLVQSFMHYFESQQAILNDPSGYLSTAYALWQQLMPPELASVAKLTLIPDGVLNNIAFDALVTAQPAPGLSLRQAPYLIRRQEVHYAWSFNVLQQQKKLHSPAKNYALSLAPGFANGERGLAPLATDEGEWPRNSTALQGNSANLQHFLEAVGNYRVVHLSTHAFAAVYTGEITRLELFDQSLYLPNIYALPLQADLVTLSACQTGLGLSFAGEGVMSLSRAFAQAGAACVISSLWSVNDQSTQQMLAGFYQRLAAGESIGQSLRAAKLGYLDDPDIRGAMQTPYCWAGLTMVGDDRVVETGRFGWKGWLAGALLLLAALYFWAKRKR